MKKDDSIIIFLDDVLIIGADRLELLDELLKLFKPLYIATVGLSQSKYVSISLTLPIYIGLTRLTRLEKKKEIAFGFFWRILYI